MKVIIWIYFVAALALYAVVEAHNLVPLPQQADFGSEMIFLKGSEFSVDFYGAADCTLVRNGWDRYKSIIFPCGDVRTNQTLKYVKRLGLNCSSHPDLQLGVDESFQLNATEAGISIYAETVFGLLHGLETLSQLVELEFEDGNEKASFYIESSPIHIFDYPKFIWRGLLIDSARHFLDVDTIKRTIDALAYNKMNTLHWHAIDAQSFPIPSKVYPLLQDGAYSEETRFSFDDLDGIIKYGKERGVRVIPEFDVPGHAASWGVGYPSITTTCTGFSSNINNIPLNPTEDLAFNVSSGFLQEMAGVFYDDYLHLGGDEVVYGCWLNNSEVSKYLVDHGMSAVDLFHYFLSKTYPEFNSTTGKKIVVWEDVYASNFSSSVDLVYQCWTDNGLLPDIANEKKYVLSSAGWYLDRQGCTYGNYWMFEDTFKGMYEIDPLDGVSASSESYVLGGEACMWGEQVDPKTIDARIWPRASAVAERLWTYKPNIDLTDVLDRLIAHRCRLSRRGIDASPLRPDYCAHAKKSSTPDQFPDIHSLIMMITWAADVGVILLIMAIAISVFVTAVLSVLIFKKSSVFLSSNSKKKKTEENSSLLNS